MSIWKQSYIMKHDPEFRSYIQIGIFIIQKKNLALHVAVNFLNETKYSASCKWRDAQRAMRNFFPI